VKHENFIVHVVDPDQAIADGLTTLLGTYGIDVLSYPDAESFLRSRLPRGACNCCLITEADLPGLSGPALLRELRDQHVEIPVLMLVSTLSPELTEAAQSSDQIGVVQKPCLDHTLIDRVLRLRRKGPNEWSNCQGTGTH